MGEISFELTIGGQTTSIEQVQDWEYGDALKACRKLSIDPQGRQLPELRQALLAKKLELGEPAIRSLLKWQVFLADTLRAVLAWGSFGNRSISSLDIVCNQGTAQGFADWFLGLNAANTPLNQTILLNGEPQHYLLGRSPEGWQEVIETAGGAPLPSHFFIHYGETEGLKTPYDPAFPVEIPGIARSKGGTAVGGVRHMLRDEGTGFRMRPLVEVPSLTPNNLVDTNRWHLATEFTNWITAYIEATQA